MIKHFMEAILQLSKAYQLKCLCGHSGTEVGGGQSKKSHPHCPLASPKYTPDVSEGKPGNQPPKTGNNNSPKPGLIRLLTKLCNNL